MFDVILSTAVVIYSQLIKTELFFDQIWSILLKKVIKTKNPLLS